MSQLEAGSAQTRRQPWRLAATVALACFAVEAYGAVRLSPTIDEPLHVARGVAFWCSSDLRLNYAHPPLANALAALPGVIARGCRELERMPGWTEIDHSQLTRAWVTTDYVDLRARIVSARWFSIACMVGLVLYGFVFVKRRWGDHAGLAFACMIAGHPSLLAHGQLATTDGPMVLCAFSCMSALIERLHAPSLRTRLWLIGAAAMTTATKHTALPALALLALCHGLLVLRSPGGTRRWLIDWTLCALASVVLVNALYRFDGVLETIAQWRARQEPANWLTGYRAGGLIASNRVLSWLPDTTPMLLPYTYVVGLLTVDAQNAHSGTSWLFGLTRSGSVFYFPVLLVAKQPVAILAAQIAALVGHRRMPAEQRATLRLPWLFAGLFLALACTSKINIGVRHVLLIVPIVTLPAAVFVARIWETHRRWVSAAALTLPLAVAIHCADFIGYFNPLVGGRRGGHAISMIGEDWGQDSWRVADLLRERGITRVQYFGSNRSIGAALRSAELERGGVRVHPAECSDDWTRRHDWGLVEQTFLLRHPGACGHMVRRSAVKEALFEHWQVFQLPVAPKPSKRLRPAPSLAEP